MKHLSKIVLAISVLFCFVAGIYCWVNPIVERVDVYEYHIDMRMGDYKQIKYKIYPELDERDCYVIYENSNPDVIRVSGNELKAIGVGEANITMRVSSKAVPFRYVEKSFRVVVSPRLVSSIELSTQYTTILVGTSAQIASTVSPENATDKTLVWTSSNPEVISVEQDGTITAQSQGTAIIRATAVGGVYKEIIITAQTEILADEISIKDSQVTLNLGSSKNLQCTFLPGNTTNTDIVWTSSNPDIVSVDENGRIVAKALGNATITATTNNGKTANCYVNVPVVEPLRFDISLEFETLISLEVGRSYKIDCSYYPSNVTYSVVWETSDSSVVSIDQTGRITVHSSGSVVITATLGSKTDYLILTII